MICTNSSEKNPGRNTIILKTPASWHGDMWREGLPSGNGVIGALVYGNVAEETILINHCRLWHWGIKNELPDISYTLAETRRLIDEGKFWEANWISANALKEKGYEAKLASPCPLCDIKVDMGDRGVFKKYRRMLNMETGEVTVTWLEGNCRFERKAFVSRADNILVYKITSEMNNLGADIYIQLHETFDKDTEKMREEVKDSLEITAEGNYIYYAATNDNGKDFGAVMKVVCDDGSLSAGENGRIKISGSSSVTAYCCFFANSEREKEFGLLKEKLEKITNSPCSYESCLERHVKLHKALFESVDIKLACEEAEQEKMGLSNEELILDAYEDIASNALIEKVWRFGRYLMISGTSESEESLPFPLYGLWAGKYRLAWPHNMANENIQMIYWHTMVGGLEYTMKAFINYYTGMMDEFRLNARRLFGCSGIYIPAGTTPGMGFPNQIVPVIMNWIGAAGWLAQHFYKYYKFSGDEKLLREKILPFMYEAAQFYMDYIVFDESGHCKIYPSVSPENTPKSLMPSEEYEHLAHPCPSAINATMDFAIIKELLGNLIEGATITGMYQDMVSKWQEILKAIPEYQKNPDGDIKEWMHPALTDRYTHRHLSHIYPVFPGTEYVMGRDDPDMLAAFELAVNKRVLGSQTGWSLAHMSCIYSRLEKPDKALECLDILIRSCLINSFFTLHNDWRWMGLTLGRGSFAPIQMDANMGFVNAVQEMLIFVSDDIVKLLPACPERFKKGKAENLRFMTGRVSFEWDRDKKYFSCIFEACRDTKIKVILPGFAGKYKLTGGHTAAGSSETAGIAIDRIIEGNSLNIDMKAGEKLNIISI